MICIGWNGALNIIIFLNIKHKVDQISFVKVVIVYVKLTEV
jgi:hypothetical protein